MKHVCATKWLLSDFAMHIISDFAFKEKLYCSKMTDLFVGVLLVLPVFGIL